MWLITVKPSYVYSFRIIQLMVQLLYNLLEDRKPLKGNTVGSRSNVEKAYIAGFLDGDGSIMLQIKKRSDTSRGYRFMATICFYQDTRHDSDLYWIREVLSTGHIAKRNDNISELRINGYITVSSILVDLKPYIRFKKLQAEAMIRSCQILSNKINTLSSTQLKDVVDNICIIQQENYKAHRKKSKSELLKMIGLTP